MSYNRDLREKYNVKTVGVSGVISSGTTESVYYKLTTNMWLSGVRLIMKEHQDNDSLNFNIIDRDFIFVGILYPSTPTEAGILNVDGLTWEQINPNGVHLDDFGLDIQLSTDKQDQGKEEPGYWAQLLSGMYIEIKYKSTGTVNVLCKANLYFHKEKQ